MKCDRRIGMLFVSRAYTQYTSIISARECKNKAVMCKPTIWIAALEHRGDEEDGEDGEGGIQSSVRGWAYLIRGRYRLHTRRTIIQNFAGQILAKGVRAWLRAQYVRNTWDTRGSRERPLSLLNTYIKKVMTELSGTPCRCLIVVEAISVFSFFFHSTARDISITDIFPSNVSLWNHFGIRTNLFGIIKSLYIAGNSG